MQHNVPVFGAEWSLGVELIKAVNESKGSNVMMSMTADARGKERSHGYLITTTAGDDMITLLDGVAQADSVVKGEMAYFHIGVADKATELTIEVTSFSGGDPDLYVGVGRYYMYPNRSTHLWESRKLGTDVVAIQAEDMQKHCVPDPSAAPPVVCGK